MGNVSPCSLALVISSLFDVVFFVYRLSLNVNYLNKQQSNYLNNVKMAMKTPSMMSLRSKIREDHLTCTICFSPFSAPKALPCLHTFCEGCIRDYVTGRGFEAQGQFPCPVCRADIPIPPGGISAFPVGTKIQLLQA